jgi:hypothetical protein
MNMSFSYQDIRMMPTRYRQWYIKRLVTHFEKRNNMYEQTNNPAKTAPDMANFDKFNEMMNKNFSS